MFTKLKVAKFCRRLLFNSKSEAMMDINAHELLTKR
jgi:hypothetical protein